MITTRQADIVILGAGIGGLETYVQLQKSIKRQRLHKKIILIDQMPAFTFTPLLHQVAFGVLTPENISISGKNITNGTPDEFLQEEVLRIDPKKNQVQTNHSNISFETCVISLGSRVNFFAVPGASEHAYTVRSLPEALQLRKQWQTILASTKSELSIVIVGGGSTGIEIAGQCLDLQTKLKKQGVKKLHISIIDNTPTLLSVFGNKTKLAIQKRIEKKGITTHLSTTVTAVLANEVIVDKGKKIASDLTIWSAGFANIGPIFVDEQYCKKGRIVTNQYLQLPNHSNIYAIGDIAWAVDAKERPYPQYAQIAHKEAIYIAKHIIQKESKKNLAPFHFRSRGTIIPLDTGYGVAEINNREIDGWVPWLLPRFIHIHALHRVQNKVQIIFSWLQSYFGKSSFTKE